MTFLLECPHCGPRDVNEFALPGRGHDAPEVVADPARALGLRLLPRQRRRRPARVVVPPPRLRGLVPRRARHAHERGSRSVELPGTPSPDGPTWTGPPDAARRRSRPSGSTARAELTFTLRRQAGAGLRGRHDRLGALRRRAARLLAQLQVPPAARPALLLGQLRQLHDDRRRRAERPRLRRAGARGRRWSRAQNVLGSLDRDLVSASSTRSAGRSRRSASTTAR